MTRNLQEEVRVGVIQTDLDWNVAWRGWKVRPSPIRHQEAVRVWSEIKAAFRSFLEADEPPNIVLIPELGVPREYLGDLVRYAKRLPVIVIAGFDYAIDHSRKVVRNEAVVIVPRVTSPIRRATSTAIRIVGKTFPNVEENDRLTQLKYRFESDPTVWRFESKVFGSFGVVICYDLLDLERAFLYRGMIQHLFVLAYNKDIDSFYHLAEALTRTLFSTVVVCNTGRFGGSVAVAPFHEPWTRVIYRHEGSRLATAQIITIPNKSIKLAQSKRPYDDGTVRKLKSLPPGFSSPKDLEPKVEKI